MVQSPVRTNPFPGLRPFGEDEEHLFFGREGQADELLKRLGKKQFLAIVGTSGSGKSSLVRAGLLPALYSGFLKQASHRWRVAVLRPGNAPIHHLAVALNDPNVFGIEATDANHNEIIIRTAITESVLRRGRQGLVEVAQQARMAPGESLLVVIDQFEELFRFKAQIDAHPTLLQVDEQSPKPPAESAATSEPSPATAAAFYRQQEAENEAAAFVKLLIAAVNHDDSQDDVDDNQRVGRINLSLTDSVPIYVVITMRSDFLGDCAQFRGLPEVLNDSQYLIPRLTRDQLHDAIEGPVVVNGGQITPRLVNHLLNETGDNPDQLPILQHALMRTWDSWDTTNHSVALAQRPPIDIADYEAESVGGMALALSYHADQIYRSLPSDRARHIAEILFRCLTERSADNREIRRPTPLQEICAVAEATETEVVEVIDAFRAEGRTFLTPFEGDIHGTTVIDISHESLMRNWQRLKKWVNNEAKSAQFYQLLANAAERHAERKASYWRDPELTAGLKWRDKQQPKAAWAKRYAPNLAQALEFLAASEAVRDQEAQAEAERTTELKQLNTRLKRSLGVVIGLCILGVVIGLCILSGGFGFYARHQEQEAKKTAAALEIQTEAALKAEREALDANEELEKTNERLEQSLTDLKTQTDAALNAEAAALSARDEANSQRDIAEKATADAQTQESIALAEKAEADRARGEAVTARTRAETEAIKARHAEERAFAAKEQEEIERANAEIERTNAKLQADALSLERRMANNLHFSALVDGLRVSQSLGSLSEQPTIALTALAPADRQMSPLVGQSQPPPAAIARNNIIRPNNRLQAITMLHKALFVDGFLERNTFVRHKNHVNDVAFSPDGQFIASSSSDGATIVWTMAGQEQTRLVGHRNRVFSVDVSKAGLIATGGDDGTVRLWTDQGEPLPIPMSHPGWVLNVRFSPDGQTIASASRDHTVKLWDLDGNELHTLSGHSNGVWGLAFSPDGQTIATASRDGTTRLWDLNGRELVVLRGHLGGVVSVSFSADGKTIATASSDRTIRLWNSQGEPLQILRGHQRDVWAVRFSPLLGDQTLASASYDGTVKIWDGDGQLRQTLAGHSDSIYGLSFSPDGQSLASASADGTIKLWQQRNTARGLAAVQVDQGSINRISYSPTTDILASASSGHTSKKGEITLWDRQGNSQTLETQAEPETQDDLDGSKQAAIWGLSFALGGQLLASADQQGTVSLWHISHLNGRELWSRSLHNGASIVDIDFSPVGQVFATASSDQTVKLWDINGNLIRPLVTQGDISHEGYVYGVSFSADGKTLATVGADNALRLWNIENGRLLYENSRAHTGPILDVSFSPANKHLIATASFDSRVKIWDVTPDQRQIVPVTLIGHTGGVKSVSFSPDGQTVVSTSFDNTVKLWDLEGKELQTLTGHTASVLSASFDKDGKTLASADSNGRIIFWNFDLNDLAKRSCIWLQDYLASPTASDEEKALCAGPNQLPSQPLATSGPLQWIASARDFVGNALR